MRETNIKEYTNLDFIKDEVNKSNNFLKSIIGQQLM